MKKVRGTREQGSEESKRDSGGREQGVKKVRGTREQGVNKLFLV